MPATTRHLALAALAASTLLAACQDREAQQPTRANFTAAVRDYLARRGHLCIARYDWPIVVTEAQRRARDADAQQMQALESLGLVTGRDVNLAAPGARGAKATVPAREYALMTRGQAYYLHVPVVVAIATRRVTHPADFCVARLSLDRVFGWERPQAVGGRTVSSVLFSYQIDPAPWTRTPEARRAFPLVMRAIDNARTLQLRLGVHLTPQGWIADELSD